jgi:hypothetical protein
MQMAAIPDTGRLEEISLPRLLIDLYRAQFDGRVELGRQRVEHTFLLTSGAAVGCESPANKNGLCDQLVAAGTITQEGCDRAISLVESKGCKEASALLELDLLDPRGLMLALRDQVRIRLLECISWPKGAFSLDSGSSPSEAANPFRIDIYHVLQAGIEAHWRADQVLRDLEPKIARFAAKNDRFSSILERLEPDDAFAAFVQALDGKRSSSRRALVHWLRPGCSTPLEPSITALNRTLQARRRPPRSKSRSPTAQTPNRNNPQRT